MKNQNLNNKNFKYNISYKIKLKQNKYKLEP